MFCREQVAQLRPIIPEIHAAGAELFAIGNGPPLFIEGFRETTGFTGPVFTDPTLAVYKAASLKRGAAGLLDPRTAADAIRALRAGHRQASMQGDAWQNGGVLLISPAGRLRYRFASSRPGQLAPPEELLAALRS